MSQHKPMVVMTIFRWSGTTFEEFMAHYKKVHSQLGAGLPGVVWYESFVNKNATASWPVIGGAPVPDAFVVMKFESQEALDNLQTTKEWAQAMRDDIGFTSHFEMFEVDRYTWVPDPDRPEAFTA